MEETTKRGETIKETMRGETMKETIKTSGDDEGDDAHERRR
jgi:hypothetical protein